MADPEITDPQLLDLLGVDPDAPEPAKPPEQSKARKPKTPPTLEAVDDLTVVETAFVSNLVNGMSKRKALFEAGGSPTLLSAGQKAKRLLEKPAIQAALENLKADLVRNAQYSFDEFITEMDKAASFAIKTKNATAYVRAVELKGKASGHLVDRIDSKTSGVGFQVHIGGIGGKSG